MDYLVMHHSVWRTERKGEREKESRFFTEMCLCEIIYTQPHPYNRWWKFHVRWVSWDKSTIIFHCIFCSCVENYLFYHHSRWDKRDSRENIHYALLSYDMNLVYIYFYRWYSHIYIYIVSKWVLARFSMHWSVYDWALFWNFIFKVFFYEIYEKYLHSCCLQMFNISYNRLIIIIISTKHPFQLGFPCEWIHYSKKLSFL